MTIQEIINKAVEGGWDKSRMEWDGCPERIAHDIDAIAFLDPKFFQALGKSMGWGEGKYIVGSGWETPKYDEENREIDVDCPSGCTNKNGDVIGVTFDPAYKYYWHALIDHLAEGKTIASYFKEL